jgi:hypothetical protein
MWWDEEKVKYKIKLIEQMCVVPSSIFKVLRRRPERGPKWKERKSLHQISTTFIFLFSFPFDYGDKAPQGQQSRRLGSWGRRTRKRERVGRPFFLYCRSSLALFSSFFLLLFFTIALLLFCCCHFVFPAKWDEQRTESSAAECPVGRLASDKCRALQNTGQAGRQAATT